jgi:regulatory protein
MRSRLISRGFAGPCIRHTLDRLVELGFLSDERFARSFIRSRVRRGETPWLAAAKARQKGVREDALNAALAASLEEYDKVAACRNLLAKRDPQSLRLVDSKIRRRQIRYLKSKGFDTATIFHVMNEDEG